GRFQSQAECTQPVGIEIGRVATDKRNAGTRSCLLRARRERPGRRAAEKRYELAAPHSMTSSARASSEDGTLMPSAFVVFILITKSYLVGACTGSSAGFSPLKMRST